MSLVFTSRYRNCNNISKPLTQTYGGKRRTKIAETVMMSGKVFFYLPKKKKTSSTVCYVMILLGLSEVLPPVASSSKNIALHKQTQGI